MNRLTVLFGLLVLLVGGAVAQDGLSHAKRKQDPKVSVDGPVTRAEAMATLNRLRDAASQVLNRPAIRRVSTVPTGTAPVTRDAVILALDRLFEASRESFRFTPEPVAVDSKALVTSDPKVKRAMERLVRNGFLARVGPLVSGPGKNIGVREFGDAIGFFLLRLSELTHTPSSKWSPYLQKPGG